MRIKIGEDNRQASENRGLLEARQQYLTEGHDWTLFFNVSFRKITSYEIAKKRFKWFFKYLNTEEEEYFKGYITCYVFYERQNTFRGGVHIHALVDRIPPEASDIIQMKARKYFGQMSVVMPYDSSRGASYYLARKIDTDKLVEYEFYVINSKIRREQK